MAPHNSTLIDENYDGFPSSQELRHYSPIPRPGRSISVHGSTSTLEQGNKEIPIWVNNEARYVAGVTSRTTCNDIIKALIDDEVDNGNNGYSRDPCVAGSRDYGDYVITECWRGVERSYDGNMAILPVWRAWSRVHNEIRLSLKRHSEVDPHPKKKKAKYQTALTSIRRHLTKLLKLLTRKKKSKTNVTCLQRGKNESDADELLFVILPDKQYDNETVTKKTEESHMKERLYRLSEKPKKRRGSIRRKRPSKKSIKPLDNKREMPIRSILRNQIAQKTSEIDQLFNKESHLLKELSAKCLQFKLQNELYTNQDHQLEISIGQIQKSIESYAEEILKTEKELLEIKNEIKHDISIINNLKRLTFGRPEEDVGRRTPSTWDAPRVKDIDEVEVQPQVLFVDNINEFCDNNASLVV